MGVVYHANYLIWMEIGRTEYGKPDGFLYSDLEREGVVMTVVDAQIRYAAPAHYDEEVTIRTRIAAANLRMIEFAYELFAAEPGGGERKLATGSTRHFFCALSPDKRELRPTKLPSRFRPYFGLA